MSRFQLVSLTVLGALIGLSQAQCYGRAPLRAPPMVAPYYGGPDDLSALLLLARAVDKSSDDVNSGEIINKLINALVYTTTNSGGAGGIGGAGGVGGAGGLGGLGGSGGSSISMPSPKPTPKPSANKDPALIDLGLLTGDDLLNLILAGQDLLRVDLGKGGGAVTKLVDGLI